MNERNTRLTIACVVFAIAVAAPAGADIYSFKGGVRIAAATCAAHPAAPGASITTATGDLSIANPNGPVKVHVICHLPVPEGATIRQFAVVGKVTAGEVFATLSTQDAKDPGQAPFFAHVTLAPGSPFEIAGKQQRVVTDLPASGSESLKVDRIRSHYIEATVESRTPVAAAQALRVFYFEVYWN